MLLDDNKCNQCGKKKRVMHCVHCGHLVCDACRNNHCRNIVAETKKQREYVESTYPKKVRDRIKELERVQKRLDERLKKALKKSEAEFEEFELHMKRCRQNFMRKTEQASTQKKQEYDKEIQMYEEHLRYNKEKSQEVASQACGLIHFPVGKLEDKDLALLCQTKKLYNDMIRKLDRPEESETPQQSVLDLIIEDVDETKDAISQLGVVIADVFDDEEEAEDEADRNSEEHSS